MPPTVHTGAQCMCTFGAAPAVLNVLPTRRVTVEGTPMATVEDSTIANLTTFGTCMSLANPTVAAATAAALGVLTPMPCVPVLQPWTPLSPTVTVGGQPVLVSGAVTMCAYGGVVNVLMPGCLRTQA